MSKRLSPLFTWRSAIASKDGPKNPTTRLVLLTLSLHMNEKGGSCFPSLTTLEEETGLNRSTITRHLAAAEADGWIRREQQKRPNGAPGPTIYEPTIPAEVGADSTHPTEEVGAQDTYVGADSTQVGAQGTPNSTGNSPYPSDSVSLRSTEPAAAAPEKSSEDPPTEEEPPQSWSTLAGEVWEEVLGGVPSFGRIGKALKPLVQAYGEEEILTQWRRYLEAMRNDGRGAFATAEDFAGRYGYYREHGVKLRRNGNGRHRTTERQQYAEALQSVEEIRWKS